MNKKFIRALAAFVSAAMLLSAVPASAAEETADAAVQTEAAAEANALESTPAVTEADAVLTEADAVMTEAEPEKTDEPKISAAESSAVSAVIKEAAAQLEKLNFNENKNKVITSDIFLPESITGDAGTAYISWTSDNTDIITDSGELVSQPESGKQEAMLTAVISADGDEKTYTYPIVVRPATEAKAFPGAQGYGTYTRGGAMGYVYHVTSLSAGNEKGTLRHALEVATGPRTIVFDVGGTIDLTPVGRALKISGDDDDHLTIAGQTAPGEGIQLKGYGFSVSNVEDLIIRNISIRIGNVRKAGDTYQSDPLSVSGVRRAVFDHLSMCWGVDMAFRVYGQEATMSNCMINKGLYWNTPHEKGKHNYAGMFGPKYGSFYGNYIADCGQRAPRIIDNEYVDVRNNVIANSKYSFDICNYEWMGTNAKFNIVNNAVLKGNPAPGGSNSNVTKGGSYKYFQGRSYSGGLFSYSANNFDNTNQARPISDSAKNIDGAIWTGKLDSSDKVNAVAAELGVINAGGYSNITSPWRDMIIPSDISIDEYDDTIVSHMGNTLVNYPFIAPAMKTYEGKEIAKYVLSNAGATSPVGGDILTRRYKAEGRTRLMILSDFSKASRTYGIRLDQEYAGDTAYGLPVQEHAVLEDENGMTVYRVDGVYYDYNGNEIGEPDGCTVKEEYKFVSCENHLDTLYAVDTKYTPETKDRVAYNKYRLVLEDYDASDDIYGAFELYDINNKKLQKPSPYYKAGEDEDGLHFKGGEILRFTDWGDGAGNYDHKNSAVTDGNIGTDIIDTEWNQYDWPQLPEVYRDGKFDSNGDGIPDFFIKLMGWDKNPEYDADKDISKLDFEGRGYTNLEYYINDYCAGDMELEDGVEDVPVVAENVHDGSSKYNTHKSHEILFNTVRRAKAKLYYCEGADFDMANATELSLNSHYDYSDRALYRSVGDFETYFDVRLSDLKPDTVYSYKIKTYSDTGVEYLTDDVYTFTTLAASTGKPAVPRITRYIPFDKQITLMFEPGSVNKSYKQTEKNGRLITTLGNNQYDTKTDHYILRYSQSPDMANASEVIIPSSASEYIIKNLENAKSYYIDLRTVSADGTESDPAVYNNKVAEKVEGAFDKDGNPVYSVPDIEVANGGVVEYHSKYDVPFNSMAVQPTPYVINMNYIDQLKQDNITDGETTKFVSLFGDVYNWYIYTLGGIPIPTTMEGYDSPMLMLRDESMDHGFTYAKKFDTVLTGKSTIRAKLMIKDEVLDPMNQAPELRFYIQQDSADLGDTDADVESSSNDAATFGQIVALQFTKNDILYNGEAIARYTTDTWYDVKLLMDGDTETCSLYINDKLIRKDMDYSDSATSGAIARWQLSSRLAGTQDVYVEYMYAYAGWEDPEGDETVTDKPVEEGTSGSRPSAGGGGGGGGGGASAVKPTVSPAPSQTPAPDATAAPSDGSEKNTPMPTEPVKAQFTDMSGYEWAEEAVARLNEKGIIHGVAKDTFAPAREITRAEFLTLLMRGYEKLDNNASCQFDDVPSGSWYYPAVAAAYSMGIVTGYDEHTFGANDKVSRQDMSVMIMRLLDKLGIELPKINTYTPFADDAQIGGYAKEAVKALYESGIINGVGNNMFAPKGTTNRAAAAKVLYGTIAAGGAAEAEASAPETID